MDLKSMTIDRLKTLREQVNIMLASKLTEARRNFEAELNRLSRYDGSMKRGAAGRQGGSVPAKYRNPDNPGETWAGRGLKPRWLSAALKAGHKIEDFLIDAAPRTASASRNGAVRNTSKARKTGAARKAARASARVNNPSRPRKPPQRAGK